MSFCTTCRLALRRSIAKSTKTTTTTSNTKTSIAFARRCQSTSTSTSTSISNTTKSTTAREILSKPTWSIQSLFSSPAAATLTTTPNEPITPSQLHHLLRLSALPLPKSKAEEDAMIATLQNQLQFVKTVQKVDTAGVEPLRAIRDETAAAKLENTIGLEDLKEALDGEVRVGHYQRPKRVRGKIEEEAENWDTLGTASKKAGKYFVVESAKKE